MHYIIVVTVCGCGWYRELFPAMMLQTLLNSDVQFRITDTLSIIADSNFYKLADGGVKLIRLQRWYGKEKAAFVKNFLKPLADQLGIWLIYEIDDLLIYDEIPAYNLAKPHYAYDKVGDSVKEIMSSCDLITVSTLMVPVRLWILHWEETQQEKLDMKYMVEFLDIPVRKI